MRWLSAPLIGVLLVLLTGTWSAPAMAQQELARCAVPTHITQARRIVTQAGQLLSDAVVDLPDSLPLAWRNEQVRLRYEIDVSVCSGLISASLSLFRVGAPFMASSNGVSLSSLLTRRQFSPKASSSDTTRDETPTVFNGRIPALLAIPLGTRTVRVDLMSLPYIPMGLSFVRVGPTNLLMPRATADLMQVVGYADAVAGVMLVLALMCLVLWLQRRHDRGFLWMTLACTSWSVRALAYFDSNVSLPPMWFEQLNAYNVLLTALCLCAATLSTMAPRPGARTLAAPDWRLRPRQIMLFVFASSSSIFLVVQLLGRGALLARAYAQGWALLLAMATIWWLWTGRMRLFWAYRAAAITAYVGLIACAVHDMGLVTGTISPTGPSYLFWGFTIVLVVYALITGDYIITTLNRAENSKLLLAQRVASKSAELESSYSQLRKTEMAGAVASARLQERERLLRDMHDGLGAQLITALRGVERGALNREQIAQSLQDGMDELRMLMDSADLGLDLSGTLAAWRNRWDSRLGAAGMQLHWHLDDSLEDLSLTSDVLLQIMRILQEAATNVVKHAGARNLYVDARQRGNSELSALVIELRDDGRGIDTQAPGRSQRGLRNMQHRASQIGAHLSVANVAAPEHGCLVRLELQTHPSLPRQERRRQARTDGTKLPTKPRPNTDALPESQSGATPVVN